MNVIDLIDAKLEKTQSLIITVPTHRKVSSWFEGEEAIVSTEVP